jgi:hypothetical protein
MIKRSKLVCLVVFFVDKKIADDTRNRVMGLAVTACHRVLAETVS